MTYPIAAVRGGHAPPYLRGISAAEEHDTTYSDIVVAAGPIAYWPLWESSGIVAEELIGDAHGTYSSDVSSWGTETGVGDGNTAPTFDGTVWVSLISAALIAAWDGDDFTVLACCKYSAAVNADGLARRVIHLKADDDNEVMISKSSTEGDFAVSRNANGLYRAIWWTGLTEIDWAQFGITMFWSSDRQRGYRNGIMNPTVRDTLQNWTEDPLVDNGTQIGSTNQTPSQPWIGSICHVAIFDVELSAEAILALKPEWIT